MGYAHCRRPLWWQGVSRNGKKLYSLTVTVLDHFWITFWVLLVHLWSTFGSLLDHLYTLGCLLGANLEFYRFFVDFWAPSGYTFGQLFLSKTVILQKNAFLKRVFCGLLFWLSFGTIFDGFSTPWNHDNTNSIREWHQNQQNHKVDARASPGPVLGAILDHFCRSLGSLWRTFAISWPSSHYPCGM